MNTFFIVGAQFDNKGAQSMLFIKNSNSLRIVQQSF